jgi:uncharacterized delta-60 repeat protein
VRRQGHTATPFTAPALPGAAPHRTRNTQRREYAAVNNRSTVKSLACALVWAVALFGTAHVHAASSDGTIDPSFGPASTPGMVTTDFNGGDDEVLAVAIQQSDDKIVAAGYAYSGTTNNDFALARYDADGQTLDTTFNNGGTKPGTVTTDFGSNGDDQARAMAIQFDRKIVVAGYATVGAVKEFAVARYMPNGALDTTFGTGGMTTTHIGTTDDEAQAVALQLDGKIVVAGFTQSGSQKDFAMVRYNMDGKLDTAFGFSGFVTTDLVVSSDDHARGVVVDGNGTITVAGYSTIPAIGATPATDDFALARYDSNGMPDPSFVNGAGKTTTNLGSVGDRINALALLPNGQTLVTGTSRNQANTNQDFAVARYTASGALDSTYGSGTTKAGTTITDFGSGDGAYAMVLQPDGKILAVGYATTTMGKVFALARYDKDGILDTTFNATGGGGAAPGTQILDFGQHDNEAHAAALQPNGSNVEVVVAGYALGGSPATKDFALARYFAFTNAASDVSINPSASIDFVDDNAATANTVTISQALTLAGLGGNVHVPVSIAGGDYTENCIEADLTNCAFGTGFAWAGNGDAFNVRHTAAGTHGQQVTTTMYFGGLVAANNYNVVLGAPTAYTFTSTVNQAPIITGTPATSVQQDSPYTFTPTSASDPDGDPISFSIANQPTWATFDTVTGTLNGTPTGVDVGVNHSIQITVTDVLGASTSLPAFDLTVTGTAPPPGGGGGGGGPMDPLTVAALAAGLFGSRRRRFA